MTNEPSGRLLPVRPRFEPGPSYSRLRDPTEAAPKLGSGKELWLLQLPPDWDYSTELRLSRPPRGSTSSDVLGVSTASAQSPSYSLVADDPSTAEGLCAFVRGSPSSSGPAPIARRATLLVDSTSRLSSSLSVDVAIKKEKKKDKKEKKEKKKDKKKDK